MLETGIAYNRLLPNLVPEIEEREAAIFNGYTWTEWNALPYWERIDGVAFARTHRLIELHKGDAEAQAMERARATPGRS